MLKVIGAPDAQRHLSVRGARVHNLQNVDLEIPRDSLVVFTGLSGSGKSSLAFDTIFAEGQRRYVESLSAYARQFLGQVDRPDVDFIEGLSPAVSIDQKSTNRNPRSTVGTITEIYDYMRLLWARIGVPHCPDLRRAHPAADRAADRRPADGAARAARATRSLSPVVSQKKGEFVDLFRELAAAGLLARRRRRRGRSSSTSRPTLKKQFKHDISVVVDRLVAGRRHPRPAHRLARDGARASPTGSSQVNFVDETGDCRVAHLLREALVPQPAPDRSSPRSSRAPSRSTRRSAPAPSARASARACRSTTTLLLGDPALSLAEGVILPWTSQGKGLYNYYEQLLEGLAARPRLLARHPVGGARRRGRARRSSAATTSRSRCGGSNRYGREMKLLDRASRASCPTSSASTSRPRPTSQRARWSEYLREVPCPVCDGKRLKPEVLAVLVARPQHRRRLPAEPRRRARRSWTRSSSPTREAKIAAQVLREIRLRLDFLIRGRPQLPRPRPRRGAPCRAARRSASAWRRRSARASPACSTCSTSRASACTSATTAASSRRSHAPRPRQHAHRRRARRGHHPHRRLDRRHRPGRRRATAARSCTRAATPTSSKNTRSLTGDYLAGRRSIPTPKQAPADRQEAQIIGRRAPRRTTCATSTSTFPLGAFTAVTGRERLGQVVARQRHPLPGARQPAQRRAPGPGQAHARHRPRPARQGRARRPGADRPHAALQPGDLHRRLRPHPHAVLRDHRGEGARLPARPLQLQRQGRPLRGVLRRRHDQDRDELPARRLRRVRGVRRQALQPRHARRCTTRARTSPRCSRCRSARRPSSSSRSRAIHRYLKTLVDVGLGLRAARPERHDPLGRRGAAREARDRAAAALQRPQRLRARRADDRPALRRRAQAAARCSTGSSTRATP